MLRVGRRRFHHHVPSSALRSIGFRLVPFGLQSEVGHKYLEVQTEVIAASLPGKCGVRQTCRHGREAASGKNVGRELPLRGKKNPHLKPLAFKVGVCW